MNYLISIRIRRFGLFDKTMSRSCAGLQEELYGGLRRRGCSGVRDCVGVRGCVGVRVVEELGVVQVSGVVLDLGVALELGRGEGGEGGEVKGCLEVQVLVGCLGLFRVQGSFRGRLGSIVFGHG